MYFDKEYLILEQLKENESLTQRQLSHRMGISVGSVNMLLNKMIREGLIKVKNIPPKRVMYMLTPAGMIEKSEKTYQYVVRNYNYINSTKQKIQEFLNEEVIANGKVYLFLGDGEFSQIVSIAVKELFDSENIVIVNPEKVNEIPKDARVIIAKDEDRRLFENLDVSSILDAL